MKRFYMIFIALLMAPMAFAQGSSSVTDAISNGDANLSFRYRWENVDDDGSIDKANAHTVRTRLNYKTSDYEGFTFFVEFDDVSYLADDKFNNTRNGQNTYATVADPDGGGLNQFYLDYKADELLFRVGRQRINLDNQRFVGGVGWRQNEQTYDSFTVVYSASEDLTVTGAFINNISRIFGPEPGNPASDLDASTLILHGHYKMAGVGNFSAYYYDFDIEDAPGASNTTMGIRYTNTFESGDLSFPVQVEFATQDDSGDNPNSYSADYMLLEGGINMEILNARVGLESLGGDGFNGSFITPAATLHKFQGWADKFLNTPLGGIDDFYITLSKSMDGHNFSLTHHDFESEEGSFDYGTELDLSYSTKLTNNLSLLAKYASYSGDAPDSDTTKFWLMLTATF